MIKNFLQRSTSRYAKLGYVRLWYVYASLWRV